MAFKYYSTQERSTLHVDATTLRKSGTETNLVEFLKEGNVVAIVHLAPGDWVVHEN